jgi:hypothetical protein
MPKYIKSDFLEKKIVSNAAALANNKNFDILQSEIILHIPIMYCDLLKYELKLEFKDSNPLSKMSKFLLFANAAALETIFFSRKSLLIYLGIYTVLNVLYCAAEDKRLYIYFIS